MRKPIATAFRLKLHLEVVEDTEMRGKIEFDIRQAQRFGVLYLASTCPEIKAIEALGFRLPKEGKYFVLNAH